MLQLPCATTKTKTKPNIDVTERTKTENQGGTGGVSGLKMGCVCARISYQLRGRRHGQGGHRAAKRQRGGHIAWQGQRRPLARWRGEHVDVHTSGQAGRIERQLRSTLVGHRVATCNERKRRHQRSRFARRRAQEAVDAGKPGARPVVRARHLHRTHAGRGDRKRPRADRRVAPTVLRAKQEGDGRRLRRFDTPNANVVVPKMAVLEAVRRVCLGNGHHRARAVARSRRLKHGIRETGGLGNGRHRRLDRHQVEIDRSQLVQMGHG